MKKKLLLIFLALLLLLAGGAAAENKLNLPEELTIIWEEAFCGDTSLSTVILPDALTQIEARAFADSSIQKLVLPKGEIEIIADDAFSGVSNMKVMADDTQSKTAQWFKAHGFQVESNVKPTPTPDGSIELPIIPF